MKAYALAAAVSAFAAFASPAKAEIIYPFCLSYTEGWSGMVERCDFSTIEQCRMSATGLNGSCEPNRRYPAQIDTTSQRRRSQNRN